MRPKPALARARESGVSTTALPTLSTLMASVSNTALRRRSRVVNEVPTATLAHSKGRWSR